MVEGECHSHSNSRGIDDVILVDSRGFMSREGSVIVIVIVEGLW